MLAKKVKQIWDNYHDKINYLKSRYDLFANRTMLEITTEVEKDLEKIANTIINSYSNINLSEKDAYIELLTNVRNIELFMDIYNDS